MGNCMNENDQSNVKIEQKQPTRASRVAKMTNDPVPSYPSIEDVLNNRRRMGNKENTVI
jgi:hypothetical protein